MNSSVLKRDFLVLSDLRLEEHWALLRRACELKGLRKAGTLVETLRGKTLALIFEKPSTRTKLSFEAAMLQLGGHTVVLNSGESQIARGEPARDTARVASRYTDIIMLRTFGDERLREFAAHSRVPVINGLSDGAHPVQLLADLMTVLERFGSLAERKVAWLGDGTSNMARSWMEASTLFGFELRMACPQDYSPSLAELAVHPRVRLTADPSVAVKDADVVTTDVWTSMGQEAESQRRLAAFQGFCLGTDLMAAALPEAIVLHCLPAHRGEEITAEVLEGPQSVVFEEAENRLHVQKALLELLLGALEV